jgi:hypothetical protein
VQATKYHRVARALRQSAADLAGLAEEGDSYGNALAIIAIHSAIAYADALSIAYGGFKSAEGEHERTADALREALGARAEAEPLRALLGIVKKKDTVSYQGIYYTVGEARVLVEKLNGFAEWAERLYEQRP